MAKSGLLLTAFLTAFSSHAALSKSDISATLKKEFASKQMTIDVKKVEESPLDNFFQVITDRGLFYVQKTGEHFFSGSLLSVADDMENLTQARLRVEHKKEIESVKDYFITYRAPEEKHEILVFYDTSCGYCQKLHNEIAQYNALGITVHYAAYPRNGLIDQRSSQPRPTMAAQQLSSIWCSPDNQKQAAFNMVARNQSLPYEPCDSGVDKQYQLGQLLGVRGTPAVFDLDANQVTRGYAPPQQMLQALETRS
jgi:thiol:disulfide interchange protein DsbC